MEVVQPPLELTFSVTDDNLDAAAFLEAVRGSPTIVWLPYEEERRAVHDYLDDERPDRLEFYVERVEFHLARLGLPSIYRPGVPRYAQDTLWSTSTT